MTAASMPRTMPDYALQTQKRYGIAGSFRGLMAAVINRALADLKKNRAAIRASDHVRDEAMAWINSPECEAFCYALDTDHKAIREQAAALYRRFLEEAEGRLHPPEAPDIRRGLPPRHRVPDMIQREPQRVSLAGNVALDKVPALLGENQGYRVAVLFGQAEQQVKGLYRAIHAASLPAMFR